MGAATRGVLGLGVLACAASAAAALPLCPLANLTGWPCPSCGLTRAALALLQGDVSEALSLHPLAPLVLLLLGVFAGGAWLGYVRTGQPVPPWNGARPRLGRLLESAASFTCAALIALWLARFSGAFGGPVSVHARWLEALAPALQVANRK
jgi:uncharacterized protein DUF2752